MYRTLPRFTVVDTGPLLVHAFGAFEGGRYLKEFSTNIPTEDVYEVSTFIEKLFRASRKLMITPLVLSEFQALAGGTRTTRFTRDRRAVFLRFYTPWLAKMACFTPQMESLITTKQSLDLWQLSFTDTSVIMAAMDSTGTVVTLDRELMGRCGKLAVDAVNPYYLYLEQS